MGKLGTLIYQYKKIIIAIFLSLTILGAVGFIMTDVNYNMTDYLPEDAESTKALDIMEEEFDSAIPNLNLVVYDIELSEAEALKPKLEASDNVKDVTWLDDAADTKVPLDTQDQDIVEQYYKNGDALYMVCVEDGNERSAIASLEEKCQGYETRVSGTAADQADSQRLAFSQSLKAGGMIVPILIIILILVTNSWIEPLFYLMTLGAAVLINLGSSIFLGEISFVTLASAPVLQMAVSLDYTVFLAKSYSRFRDRGQTVERSLIAALNDASTSITASMLTTFFGFIALLFMQFRIGSDMGISLVKGVALSYICTMLFLPALLAAGDDLIKRTRHKQFLPDFKGISRIVKFRIPIALIIFIIMVPAFLGQTYNHFFYGSSEYISEDSNEYIVDEEFGVNNAFVILVPRGNDGIEKQLCDQLKSMDHVKSVISYSTMVGNQIPDSYLTDSQREQFRSKNYSRIILYLDVAYEGDQAFALTEKLRKVTKGFYPEGAYTCGQCANMYDMKTFVEADNKLVGILTVLSIYLILFFMTGNLLTPILLILTIKCSIWLNMCIPYFTGAGLCYVGYLIVSTVQLGATVDYAILLTNTYNEERLKNSPLQAMKNALGNSFSSIMISAATMTGMGYALMLSAGNEVVKAVGSLTGRGAFMALAMVVFLMPFFLVAFDKVNKYFNVRLWLSKILNKRKVEKV